MSGPCNSVSATIACLEHAVGDTRQDQVVLRRGLMVYRAKLDQLGDIVAGMEKTAVEATTKLAEAAAEARAALANFRATMAAIDEISMPRQAAE